MKQIIREYLKKQGRTPVMISFVLSGQRKPNGDDRAMIAKLCNADYADMWLNEGGLNAWLAEQETKEQQKKKAKNK